MNSMSMNTMSKYHPRQQVSFFTCQSPREPIPTNPTNPARLSNRQYLGSTILAAILALSLGSTGPLGLTHETYASETNIGTSIGVSSHSSPWKNTRPAWSSMNARLASWDADPQADGWLVTLQVVDQLGNPVLFHGNVTFELVPFDANETQFKTLRWTSLLQTDPLGCATFRLPLRKSLHTRKQQRPDFGILTSRTTIAGAGTYIAETIVEVDPRGLVDTLRKPR